MNDKNKFIFILILVLSLTGCIKIEPQLTIALGGAPNEIDYWEKVLENFRKKTSINAVILRQPADTDQRRQNIVIPLKAEKPDPDVFLMDAAWVGQFTASGWLLPLDIYIENSNVNLKSFFPAVLKQIDTYKDNIIALPVYVDSGILYYRKDLLKKYKCSVPDTWEDLIEFSLKIQEQERRTNKNFYGFVWQGAQYEGLICCWLEFLTSGNGNLDLYLKNIALNDKENLQAVMFMRDLIHRYKISPPNTYTEMKEEEVRQYFENGNALFERNWPYAAKLHNKKNSIVNDKWAMTVLPKFRNGRHAAALGGWHIGISRFSDKKDEAWELVKYVTSYDTQKKFTINLGWNPGRIDIYSDPAVIKENPDIAVLKKAFSFAVSRPVVPYYTLFSEIMQRYINSVIAGTLAPEKAMSEAQIEVKKITEIYNE